MEKVMNQATKRCAILTNIWVCQSFHSNCNCSGRLQLGILDTRNYLLFWPLTLKISRIRGATDIIYYFLGEGMGQKGGNQN